MKRISLFLFFLIPLLVIYYSGCDDSGVLPHLIPKGRIAFTPSNLKTLDVNTDGWYNLWIGLDSAGTRQWFSAGEFNINSSGSPVDLSGNAMSFVFSGDTNSISFSKRAMVTIEKQHNIFPSQQRLICGNLTSISDSISCMMDISGDEALGIIGSKLLQGNNGFYILNTPSTNNANCGNGIAQGIWLCDTAGVPTLPDSLTLPVSGGWIYQGWVVDLSINRYYSMGKFFNPYSRDLDTSGACAGPNPGFNAPGQDWIQSGGNCPPQAINLKSGNFSIFVSLEPSNESGSGADNSPFFVRLFSQNRIDQSLGCGQKDNLNNQKPGYPTGRVRIAN